MTEGEQSMHRDLSLTLSARGGRRCVAGGCLFNESVENGISLHSFPMDKPATLWVGHLCKCDPQDME
jgi:hypothetical protein